MTDIDVILDDDASVVPLVGETAPTVVRVRKRGRVTKWLAIGWLVFIVVSSIGAESLPYINHSCDQFDNISECTTATHANIRLAERPPAWAGFVDAPLPGEPVRFGLMGTDKNGFDLFARSLLGARTSLIIGGLSKIGRAHV